jgi:hypothetical protein
MPGADWAEKREALGGFQTLQTHVTQRSFLRAVADVDRELATLRKRLDDIQTRGYAFGRAIGAEIEDVAATWTPIAQAISEAAIHRAEAVAARLAELRSYADILDISEGVAAQIQANKLLELMAPLKAELATLSADVVQQINTQARDVPARANALTVWLDAVEASLKRATEAGFELRPGEAVVLALEAEWRPTNGRGDKDKDRDAVRGMLYLTDQRLIMEAHEWQGGILGLGGKKVQRVAWEGPYTAVHAVKRVPSSDESEEALRLELAEPAQAESVELIVRGLPVVLAEVRLRDAILSPPEQSRWSAPVEASETDERST